MIVPRDYGICADETWLRPIHSIENMMSSREKGFNRPSPLRKEIAAHIMVSHQRTNRRLDGRARRVASDQQVTIEQGLEMHRPSSI
jgi:hypothetical protein